MATSSSPKSIAASRTLQVAVQGGAVLGFTGTNGDIVTVTGSGFSALTNPRPSSYDTFNEYGALSEGDVIPTGPGTNWTEGNLSSAADFELDSEITLPGRSLSAKAQGRKATILMPAQNPEGPSRSGQLYYVTWWIRFNESLLSGQPNNGGKSDKVLRAWEATTLGDGVATKTSYEATSKLAQYYDPNDAAANFNYPPSSSVWGAPNTWHRVGYGIDRQAGKQYLWQNGRRFTYDWFADLDETDAPPGELYTRLLGYDPASSSDVNLTLRHWLADFYEHPSPVTIELTNSDTWDESAEKTAYLQKCLSATETEVQFEAFYGDLDTQSPIYAFQRQPDWSMKLLGRIN